MKRALLVTRVSGFIPQFEMDRVHILQKMGYEVHYAANYSVVAYGKDNSALDYTGIVKHHIEFPRNPFSVKTITAYRQLKTLIEKGNFDIIHCHMPITGILTRLAAESVKKGKSLKQENNLKNKNAHQKVIYTAHGFHFFRGAPLKNWLYYIPERFCSRYTDFLVTINDEDYRRSRRFPVRGRCVKIPGIGMNLDNMKTMDEITENKKDFRVVPGDIIHENQIKIFIDNDIILLSVGELNAVKNHIRIMDMMRHFKGEKVYYIICGDGDMKEELIAYIEENDLQGNVFLMGYRNDIEEFLLKADIFILPSLREGLPVALMEAMVAGLPIIAGDIRGCSELVDSGKGGILVNRDESLYYEKAVRKLISLGKEKRKKIGAYNQKKIEKYSRKNVNLIMEKVYRLCEK